MKWKKKFSLAYNNINHGFIRSLPNLIEERLNALFLLSFEATLLLRVELLLIYLHGEVKIIRI